MTKETPDTPVDPSLADPSRADRDSAPSTDEPELSGLAALAAALREIDPNAVKATPPADDEEGWEEPTALDLAELEKLHEDLMEFDDDEPVGGNGADATAGQDGIGADQPSTEMSEDAATLLADHSDGGGDDAEDDGLAALMAAIGQEAPEEPVEAPPQPLTPERLCYLALEMAMARMLKEELLEFVSGKQAEDILEELVDEVLKAASFHAALTTALTALVDSEQVEEVYGDDDELLRIFRESFDAIQQQADSA